MTALLLSILLTCVGSPAGPAGAAALTLPAATTGGIASIESTRTISAAPAPTPALPDDRLQALFEEGATYEAFLERASRRKALWQANTESGTVPDSLLERARSAGGPYYLLAVAVDGCSDSVSTIPFLADLADAVEGLEMRIISSQLGLGIMDSHKTPDGRSATPTILLLNAEFDEVGALIERPAPLQDWAMTEGAALQQRDFVQQKMAWYEEDNGLSTVAQMVALLEAASGGR